MNNCFSIYHTSWITSGPKSNFICENIATKAILFSFGCSEVNSTWLITSELANQRARKVLFTCVVYTNCLYVSCIISSRCSVSFTLFLNTVKRLDIKLNSASFTDWPHPCTRRDHHFIIRLWFSAISFVSFTLGKQCKLLFQGFLE